MKERKEGKLYLLVMMLITALALLTFSSCRTTGKEVSSSRERVDSIARLRTEAEIKSSSDSSGLLFKQTGSVRLSGHHYEKTTTVEEASGKRTTIYEKGFVSEYKRDTATEKNESRIREEGEEKTKNKFATTLHKELKEEEKKKQTQSLSIYVYVAAGLSIAALILFFYLKRKAKQLSSITNPLNL